MKTLSILQPWAWLIVNKHKGIENRDTLKNFRGKFLVHAGQKRPSKEKWIEFQQTFLDDKGIVLPDMDKIDFGGIVGEAEAIDCVQKSNDYWFVGKNGFVLSNQKTLPFMPCVGRLNWFNVDYIPPEIQDFVVCHSPEEDYIKENTEKK